MLGPDPAALSPRATREWHSGGESGTILRGTALALVLGSRCPGELEQPQHTRKSRHPLLMRPQRRWSRSGQSGSAWAWWYRVPSLQEAKCSTLNRDRNRKHKGWSDGYSDSSFRYTCGNVTLDPWHVCMYVCISMPAQAQVPAEARTVSFNPFS